MTAMTTAKAITNKTATAIANQTAKARQVMKGNTILAIKMVVRAVFNVIQGNTLSRIVQRSQDQVNAPSAATWVTLRTAD